MKQIRYTKTSTFIFPLLEIPKTFFQCDIRYPNGNMKYNTRFLNSYLKDENIIQYQKDSVFLVTRGYRDKDFKAFHDSIINLPNYIDEYEKRDLIIYMFTIPSSTKDDYHLLLNGQYSKITESSKKLILKNHFYTGESTTIPEILYKSPRLRTLWEERLSSEGSEVNMAELEVWSKLNMKNETLTRNIISEMSTKSSIKIGGS